MAIVARGRKSRFSDTGPVHFERTFIARRRVCRPTPNECQRLQLTGGESVWQTQLQYLAFPELFHILVGRTKVGSFPSMPSYFACGWPVDA